MVAGHLREAQGNYHIILSYQDEFGKRKTKSISTGLPVKGNKKRAEAMLMEARKDFYVPDQAMDSEEILFSDYMLKWLKMMRTSVEETTFASYSMIIESKIAPYFREKQILLRALAPADIQAYYQYGLDVEKVKANTVIHRHANIRKALQYAVKTGLIDKNPADMVERPKKEKFVGGTYNEEELNALFLAVKGQPIEFAVIAGAFYGLRRSEIIGLKCDGVKIGLKIS